MTLQTHKEHVQKDGGYRSTLTYDNSYAIETCECGYQISRECEHAVGIWPNRRSVCEWNEDGTNLTCMVCGIDAT